MVLPHCCGKSGYELLVHVKCHYDGNMAKTTLRIPDFLLEKLRERSRDEGRSLNAVAVDTLTRGLGLNTGTSGLAEILGDLVARPATKKYDRERVEELLAEIPTEARHLAAA